MVLKGQTMNLRRDDIEKLMVSIPAGTEKIRAYRDGQKWLSLNSKMSIPGQKGNMEETQSMVEVDAFYLAKHPVTRHLYDVILSKKPYDEADDGMPMVNVSWDDAIAFCNLLSESCGLKACYIVNGDGGEVMWDRSANGYRLPTDAEWQYACKAGSTGYRYGPIDDIAWHEDNSNATVHPVGLKAPNNWGLYDMLGNIWEWCWDLYDEQTYGSYRVFRGGSWAETTRVCGATCRRRSHPDFAIDDLGFRMARSH